jgi:hypothetical protein
MSAMAADQLSKIEISEDIAVEHQERFVELPAEE